MKTRQLKPKTPVEALVVEKALLLVRELEEAGRNGKDGEVLYDMEGVIVDQGRDLLRVALEASLNAQAETLEKKGRRVGNAPVGNSATGRGRGTEKS
jgi:hypothetical protein